mmetsp:Transcript_18988/g.40042  ORF Transcript_18988/g.40042 Transcript_18988/m.40042 type:complete len:817 (-) Transcript_18988:112-2562(-)
MPAQSKMTVLPSKLALVSIYAIVVTIGFSHYYVRDLTGQLQQNHRVILENEALFYERHFLPNSPSRRLPRDNSNTNSSSSIVAKDHGGPRRPTFPIKAHVVTQGKARTATTLLFNMAAVSHFLYLLQYKPKWIPDVHLTYWQRPHAYKFLRRSTTPPHVIKTHMDLNNFLADNVVVFAAAKNKKMAREMKQQLVNEGHTVAFVQDMETLKEVGVPGLVQEYVAGFGLSEKDEANLNEYFRHWEILRQCCGQQMSMKWRNDLMPQEFKVSKFKSHPTCKTYNIDAIEQAFMQTELYSTIEQYPSIQPLNKPSLNDGHLNGTYCSSYADLVRTQGLSIWGKPGGRPVRTKLDGAIKDQMHKGRTNLKPEGYYLFPETNDTLSTRLRKMWKRPENEKKKWLRAVLVARTDGGKSYADYNIPPTTDSADEVNKEDGGFIKRIQKMWKHPENEKKESGKNYRDNNIPPTTDSADDFNEEVGDIIDVDEIELEESFGDDLNSFASGEEGLNSDDAMSVDDSKNELMSPEFDKTHAIFLISFGKQAAESTLVERCILSLHRRGAYDGYIVVLTDAPPERYQNEWDVNVIVMHPLEEHLQLEDGSPIQYTKENTSLKSKRFKTFIIDYIAMDTRLDSVDLIYYLDIDILAGNAMGDLFHGVEDKYEISREERSGGLSKLYFFQPLSKEWPLQGGTFIVERKTSRHCLELWRKEIDAMTIKGRGRDQDGLRNIYERIQSGDESQCQMIRMANENYINFPTPRTFVKMTQQSVQPNLIHISNSVFAKWIGDEKQNEYIHDVLLLSEEEIKSGKYGKVIVNAKLSDM